MFAVVSTETIQLPPGALVRLPATWEEYQLLCSQRGDRAIPRLKYRDGEVLLMSPLLGHGRDVSLVADIIKVLLDSAGDEYDSFTPVTMEIARESGIEPDYCFYIDNWAAISGKERISWGSDPPPDLVLEVDVTSYSNVEDYLPYEVPEVWLLRRAQLQVCHLQNNAYTEKARSQFFPGIDIQEIVAWCLKTAYTRNTSVAIRELRRKLMS